MFSGTSNALLSISYSKTYFINIFLSHNSSFQHLNMVIMFIAIYLCPSNIVLPPSPHDMFEGTYRLVDTLLHHNILLTSSNP